VAGEDTHRLVDGVVWRSHCGGDRHILSQQGVLHLHGPPLHFLYLMIPL
jgi:hypothetical protein